MTSMNKSVKEGIWICMLFAPLPFLVGCGNGMARVHGEVTFNGEPVSRGMINLEPVDGKGQVVGSAVEGGKYSIKDVLPGEKIVRISAVYVVRVSKENDGGEVEICDDLLPASYGQTSNYRIDVKDLNTRQDYNIEGPDPRKGKKK